MRKEDSRLDTRQRGQFFLGEESRFGGVRNLPLDVVETLRSTVQGSGRVTALTAKQS